MINQSDNAEVEKLEAETKRSANTKPTGCGPVSGWWVLLKKICAVQELDYDEVVQRLGSQDFSPSKKDVIDSE